MYVPTHDHKSSPVFEDIQVPTQQADIFLQAAVGQVFLSNHLGCQGWFRLRSKG